jgi:hypothetical protein
LEQAFRTVFGVLARTHIHIFLMISTLRPRFGVTYYFLLLFSNHESVRCIVSQFSACCTQKSAMLQLLFFLLVCWQHPFWGRYLGNN